MLESEWANLAHEILHIEMEGTDTVVWDWRGDVPVLLDEMPVIDTGPFISIWASYQVRI